ncbi:unnamed protein product [Allacma fusca]|uniref:TLC domain-containing protein n=1 Tax=Allacma fusca TaxID=39272 RepID=A0A8J2JM75_9HEXA|nr:unnamed protein product [Allacma fusca]
MGGFLNWFWNPRVWLPPGTDWKDIVPNEKVNYTRFEDLYVYPIPFAICIIILRFFVERLVFYPLGEAYGLTKRRILVPPNPYLERHYKLKSSVDVILKKSDLDKSQVLAWLRKRKRLDKPSTLDKFSECSWRFTCYAISVLVGIWTLYDKPWFSDINKCWYDFPHHSIDNDVWWYYMLGSAFYWSLMISQFFDVQRKDWGQMCLHHMTTIALLGFSWTCNMIRMGTLVLLLHDIADPFLELAKTTRYIGFHRACDWFFGTFAILFIITRLIIYPGVILKSTMYEAPMILPMFAAYYIFNSMLLILLGLHVFWTYFILKVAVKALRSGQVDDARSSSETSGEESS